jgi:hypothetical protein
MTDGNAPVARGYPASGPSRQKRTAEESFEGLLLEADWMDMHGGDHHDDNCEGCRDIANVRAALSSDGGVEGHAECPQGRSCAHEPNGDTVSSGQATKAGVEPGPSEATMLAALMDIRFIANSAGNPRTMIARIFDIATRGSRGEYRPDAQGAVGCGSLTFGAVVENIAASDRNPIKRGIFIRKTSAKMAEYATKEGVHSTPLDNLRTASALASTKLGSPK